MDRSPTIAIVGRPNVGKSTLFNRLIGKKHAVIAKEAGTTRDRISHKLKINGIESILIDTGGIEQGSKGDIEEDIQRQAELAISDADITLFIVDITQDLTVDDFAAAEILRKSQKPIILVANKCDNAKIEENIFNIFELGFGEPIKISAIHKQGIEVLESKISKKIKDLGFKKNKKMEISEATNLCILGKPNAGKSSLVNALLNDDTRTIVSNIPGTTRDSTDSLLEYNKTKYNLIDTAGLRRPGKRSRGIEKFSVIRCFNSIERSDIVVLLIDGKERISNQDLSIANYALEAKKGLIIAINKIDLLESGEDERERILNVLHKRFAFAPWAPVIFVSAKDKKNIFKILEISNEIVKERKKRIKTSEINAYLQKITYKHLPASRNLKKPKFMYGSQVDIIPPKFILFFKNASNLHFSYPRYLENQIRQQYGFNGTPITLKIKNKL